MKYLGVKYKDAKIRNAIYLKSVAKNWAKVIK